MNTAATHTVGRRKTAVASLRLVPSGENALTVNGKSPKAYFKTEERVRAALAPFAVAEAAQNYAASARASGGGIMAQAGAVRHALARALIKAEPATRPALKAAGLLTRDPRAKERKKPGLVKARKRKQWSKR